MKVIFSKHACSHFFHWNMIPWHQKGQKRWNLCKIQVMYLDYCRPKYRISLYISYISENSKICYSHAINLKFGQDHTIDKRNVSCKFHQNPTRGRYFSKICLQMRPEFTSKYWQNFKKYLPHAGFWWNLQETFLLSIVWSCPNFKLIAWLYQIFKFSLI